MLSATRIMRELMMVKPTSVIDSLVMPALDEFVGLGGVAISLLRGGRHTQAKLGHTAPFASQNEGRNELESHSARIRDRMQVALNKEMRGRSCGRLFPICETCVMVDPAVCHGFLQLRWRRSSVGK